MIRVAEQTGCDQPTVSVAVITYNHEQFIAQAIESVLMQETEFVVELVIGEDCSTDGTRRIVQAYAGKYPNVIRALLPERNLGMAMNYEAVWQACRGKYIACSALRLVRLMPLNVLALGWAAYGGYWCVNRWNQLTMSLAIRTRVRRLMGLVRQAAQIRY
jgi:hypothetical protein